jgi:hypothetical protein
MKTLLLFTLLNASEVSALGVRLRKLSKGQTSDGCQIYYLECSWTQMYLQSLPAHCPWWVMARSLYVFLSIRKAYALAVGTLMY